MVTPKDRALAIFHSADTGTADPDVASGGEIETREEIQQGALAGAAPPHHGHKLALADGGGQFVQDIANSITLLELLGHAMQSNELFFFPNR